MTAARISKLPVVLTFITSALLACSDPDHPPPVGRGGRDGGRPGPVIVDFGGTSNAGVGGGMSTDGAGVDTVAGSGNDTLGGASFAGTPSSFGGTPSAFGGSAGDSSTGATLNLGGSDALGGTTFTTSFSGSFSTGGL